MERMEPLWRKSAEVCLCVYLICCGLQLVTGCKETSGVISCSPGESVLMPCVNSPSQYKDIQWWFSRPGVGSSEYCVFPLNCRNDQRYTDRFHLHKNLSLSITDVTEKDSGGYWCKNTESETIKYFSLTVEGCSISENEESVKISKYSGEFVLITCSLRCSYHRNPDQWGWKLPNNREITTTKQNDLHHGRVQMFDISSGNLSLLISDLTEKDEGLYSCWINKNQHKNFSLTVEGCKLSENERNSEMKYPGDSVLLSCSCKDSKARPENFTWVHLDSGTVVQSNDTSRYKGRVHMFHKSTPSNLSLLIFNLTEEDQGIYRCSINNNISTQTSLTVKASGGFIMNSITGLKLMLQVLVLVLMLLMLGMTACIYWRCMRAKKNKHGKSLRPDDEGDVTYSTVVHLKGRKPDRNQQENDVTYNVVALSETVQTTKSEDDVTYSTIVHSKSHTDQAPQMSPEENVTL